MARLARIASISPPEVDEEELDALDKGLKDLSDQFASDRQEGDLIAFVTNLSVALRRGEKVTLYVADKS